jgi:hypothetical protein
VFRVAGEGPGGTALQLSWQIRGNVQG